MYFFKEMGRNFMLQNVFVYKILDKTSYKLNKIEIGDDVSKMPFL